MSEHIIYCKSCSSTDLEQTDYSKVPYGNSYTFRCIKCKADTWVIIK